MSAKTTSPGRRTSAGAASTFAASGSCPKSHPQPDGPSPARIGAPSGREGAWPRIEVRFASDRSGSALHSPADYGRRSVRESKAPPIPHLRWRAESDLCPRELEKFPSRGLEVVGNSIPDRCVTSLEGQAGAVARAARGAGGGSPVDCGIDARRRTGSRPLLPPRGRPVRKGPHSPPRERGPGR